MNVAFGGRKWARAVAAVFILVQLMPVATAQIRSSSISGSVTDATGAAVPGVTVTLIDKDTGVSRSNTTGPTGFYSFAGLSIGDYVVKAEKAGFASQIKGGIFLNVNQQAEVNIADLRPATVTSAVTISAASTALETASSTVSGLVETHEINVLPLNGRDFTRLALLQPGVSAASVSGANPLATGGGIARYSVNGIRPTGNNFLIDGQDVNDPSFNVPLGGVSGQALGQDAIAEFSVLTSTYTAQYGRNAGAVVNAVSKSGTNAWHGSAYEFLRNSALDARNFFDRSIPPFKRNDFGGTLGGPIAKNNTFFFVNYEGFRERLGVTTVATVPDALAHQGIIPVTTPTGGRVLTQINVSPAVNNILALYPQANGSDNGDGTAQYFGFGNQPTNEDYVLGRVDHYFSGKDNVFLRYNFDNSAATVPFASTPVPGFPAALSRRNQFATLQELHIFTPHLINSASASYTRFEYASLTGESNGLSISLVPGNTFLGAISLSGLSGVGYSLNSDIGATSNVFDYAENLNWEAGRNLVKFGAEVKRLQINSFFNGQLLGSYNVGSLLNFLQGSSLSYQGVPAGSTSARNWRQLATAFFVQDDFHVSQDLTINLGLRYEFSTVPRDTQGRETKLVNPATDTSITVGAPLYKNPTDLNFAPRVGFAWTPPIGDRKTVIRSGFGIFYDFAWENVYGNSRFTPPFFRILFTPNAPFPTPPSSGSGVVAPQIFTYTPRNPYSLQYNFNIQRDLGHNFIFSTGYVGTKGEHLFRVVEANPNVPTILANGLDFFPPTARRINPNFGPIRERLTDAISNYNGLQTSLNKQFTHGFRLQVSYTFAKSLDDSSGPFQTDTVSQPANTADPYNAGLDYGLSAFDVRNVLVVNYTYELPFGPGKMFGHDARGVLAKAIVGWTLNGIDTFETGRPFTVTDASNVSNSGESGTGIADRPNVTPGYSNNPTSGVSSGCAGVPGGTLGTPVLYFNPCAFSVQPRGFFGNVGRNTLIGPRFTNFDLSFIKVTPLTERVNLEFRGEFFNLFNHANFQVPSNVGTSAGATSGGDFVFDASRNRIGNAGRIFSTVTPSREIQFAVKFTF